MMRHRKIEKLLVVYRSLDADQRQLVDAHVRTCPSCTARLAVYEEMDRALFALPSPTPDPRMRSLVMDTLAGHADMTLPDRRNRRLAPRVFPLVVAVALVLVLGIAAIFMARGFVRTPSVQPKVVRPVLVETPTVGSTPVVVQTVEVSASVVPAEIQAVVDEVLRHTISSTALGAARMDVVPTIRRFRQADDWAVIDVSYEVVYEGMATTNLSARQVIALQQAPGGVWKPAELIYMPEMTLRQLWGPQKTLSLRHLDLVYYEFDEPFVRSALAASNLDAFVEGAASTLQSPLEANERLTLRIAPDRSALWEDEALMQVDGLSDLPLGDLVLTPTPGVFTPLAPLPNTSELSTVVGSTDLDVGLTIFSRLRRVAFLELARQIARETAPSVREFPVLVNQLAMWEAGPPAYPVGPDISVAMLAQLPARFQELPPLSELLAPSETIDDAWIPQDMPYSKAMIFLAFLEETYGKQAFGPLVRALFGETTWEDVVRTAFTADPAEFEAQVREWLAAKVTSVPGIVERDMAAATALAPLPSVTYSPAFATQEAAYAQALATQTAQALLTPSPTATATPLLQAPPPDPRSLSGLVYRTTDGLWLVGADGKASFLSNQPYGALSPDAAQMVTSEDGDLWLANLTTGERRNLTKQQDGVAIIPQWWPARPDVVIFGSHRSGDYASFGFLTAVGTDGQGYQLLDGQEGSFEKPALGQDGQTIAYDRGGKPYLHRWGVGSEPIDVSQFSGVDLAGLRMANPAWSPDESKLAWLVYGELDEGSTLALAVMDLARLEARLVHPYLVQPMGGFPPAATWSPDGQWVAFSAYDQDPSRSGVWVVRADASQECFLGAGSQPVWHPDGNRLAFSRFDAASGSRIVIADAVTWAVAELAEPKDGTVADWIRLDQVD